MKKYCLACDLKDDPTMISEYEDYHRRVRPEILQSMTNSGIEQMEIYRVGNRMFMIMEVNETFDFEKKALADAANEKVQEWEQLMWKFQQPLPWAKEGEKWIVMDKIFQL